MNDMELSEFVRFFITRLLERSKETIEESGREKDDAFQAGRRMAYYEVMDILKSELEVRDADLKELGLDIDLEQMFFS